MTICSRPKIELSESQCHERVVRDNRLRPHIWERDFNQAMYSLVEEEQWQVSMPLLEGAQAQSPSMSDTRISTATQVPWSHLSLDHLNSLYFHMYGSQNGVVFKLGGLKLCKLSLSSWFSALDSFSETKGICLHYLFFGTMELSGHVNRNVYP